MAGSDRVFPSNGEMLRLFKEAAKHKPFFSVILLFSTQCLIGIGLFSLPVYSHPSPIAYKPQPNQTINATQTLPTGVTIVFNERPELKLAASYTN